MKRETDILSISVLGEIPTLETIRAIPRERILKIVFSDALNSHREKIGVNLKRKLPGFQVGIHTFQPEINIAKLITDKEVVDNQEFFEVCAQDYRRLAEELIFKLVDKLGVKLNEDFPMETFNELKWDERQIGRIESWKYNVHGFHCGFENEETGQVIEVPLVFGLEFGDLDPYFFTRYIKSTLKYNPMPVEIFEDYADGVQINEKMISLGKFERIGSNVGNHYGVVVADRKEVGIKSYDELNKLYGGKSETSRKPKFSFWSLIGLKK